MNLKEPNTRSWLANIACVALSGCSFSDDGLLGAAGPVARALRDHLISITALTLVVIVPVFVFLPFILWRNRLGRNDTDYRPDWNFSWPLEFAIWGIPVAIVAFLGWNLWHHTHTLDPYAPRQAQGEPIPIDVIGLDWKWLFINRETGIASVNSLVVPVGRDLAFRLTSDATMQSFMIPRLGGQIYAMAGMQTRLHLVADEPGTYRGINTQFNGKHFHEQRFIVDVVPTDQYRRWLAKAQVAPALTTARYVRLARPGVSNTRIYGSAPDDLFSEIVKKYHHAGDPAGPMPGDAPQLKRPSIGS